MLARNWVSNWQPAVCGGNIVIRGGDRPLRGGEGLGDPLLILRTAQIAGQVAAAGEAPATVGANDAVLFMNFRADRARQLTRAVTSAGFDEFERRVLPQLADFVTTTEYAADLRATGDLADTVL